jgi:hypothetical protein
MKRALAAAALALLVAGPAPAQQATPANGVLLVARPDMQDPNFARTVVLVTQADDGHTLGVVLNRPTAARHGASRCGSAARCSSAASSRCSPPTRRPPRGRSAC